MPCIEGTRTHSVEVGSTTNGYLESLEPDLTWDRKRDFDLCEHCRTLNLARWFNKHLSIDEEISTLSSFRGLHCPLCAIIWRSIRPYLAREDIKHARAQNLALVVGSYYWFSNPDYSSHHLRVILSVHRSPALLDCKQHHPLVVVHDFRRRPYGLPPPELVPQELKVTHDYAQEMGFDGYKGPQSLLRPQDFPMSQFFDTSIGNRHGITELDVAYGSLGRVAIHPTTAFAAVSSILQRCDRDGTTK